MCYAKNVKNQATFVEGFWPEFYARGGFMKYSMSAEKLSWFLGRIACFPGSPP